MEGKNGPFCRGLSEVAVQSAEDLLELMRTAQQQRQVGETNMNKQSSRSHCIFTLKVSAKRQLPDGSVLDSTGKLHCCDLAGSECAKSANLVGEAATGEQQQAARERERMNINRSLLTLGRVVSTLKELSQNPTKKSVRIPYRYVCLPMQKTDEWVMVMLTQMSFEYLLTVPTLLFPQGFQIDSNFARKSRREVQDLCHRNAITLRHSH